MSNHQSSQSAIVNKLKKFGRWSLTLLPEFLVLIQLKVKCLMKCDELQLLKTCMFFHMTIRKQTAYGMYFMNEQQSNSQEHEDCSKWQYKKTWLL